MTHPFGFPHAVACLLKSLGLRLPGRETRPWPVWSPLEVGDSCPPLACVSWRIHQPCRVLTDDWIPQTALIQPTINGRQYNYPDETKLLKNWCAKQHFVIVNLIWKASRQFVKSNNTFCLFPANGATLPVDGACAIKILLLTSPCDKYYSTLSIQTFGIDPAALQNRLQISTKRLHCSNCWALNAGTFIVYTGKIAFDYPGV